MGKVILYLMINIESLVVRWLKQSRHAFHILVYQ